MEGIRAEDQPILSDQFQRLSGEACQRIHSASLEVMERTGVRLYDQEAIDLLRTAGARISEGNRARIPSKLVDGALTTVPKRVVLFNRQGHPAMPLEEYRSFYGPGSDCLNIIDHRTGERRKPVLQDLVEGMTVADALPNIDFVMSLVLPSDVPQMVTDRYQMEAMLGHTSKPIVFVSNEFSGCVDAIEMAEAVAGGPDALRQAPFVTCYINVTTGLRHNQDSLKKLLYLSDKGLPAIYIPVGQGGTTAPVTIAGCQVIWNVGALVGLVLSQLKRSGAPYVMGSMGPSSLDMRTLVQPYSSPDKQGVAQAMAHFYNVPMFALGGCTDAKCVDQQAGIEAALTLMMNALTGSHIVHDLGYLESGLCYSLVQLVICNEIVSWLGHGLRGVDVSDVALAVDLIDKVGPDGQFLDSDHTRAHFRERWYPTLFERDKHSRWVDQGSKTLAQRAADRVESILTEHRPEPISPDAAKAVHAIVERATKELAR
jgi:trimethylamine--corrinoid protein Co-methyltransferase